MICHTAYQPETALELGSGSIVARGEVPFVWKTGGGWVGSRYAGEGLCGGENFLRVPFVTYVRLVRTWMDQYEVGRTSEGHELWVQIKPSQIWMSDM